VTDRQLRWMARRRAEHRCTKCGGENHRKTWLCRACQERKRRARYQLRQARHRAGRCVDCNGPLSAGITYRCRRCAHA